MDDAFRFSFYLILAQALTMAAEANSTMFEPITQALLRYFQEADRRMRTEVPLQDWAAERYMDMILSVHWLLENAPQGQEQSLWDLADLCKEQGWFWLFLASTWMDVDMCVTH